MKCLVLGGGGFIGSHLSEALHAQGYFVRVFDRPNIRRFSSGLSNNMEWFEGDFINPKDLSAAMESCDIVIHLIAMTLPNSSNRNPIYDLEANAISTLHLLEIAQRHRIKKIIFVSSGGTIYGIPQAIPLKETHPTEPTCAYGISKLAIEKYLALYQQMHGLDFCVLRLANPFGPRQRTSTAQGAVTVFLEKALRGEMIEIWGDGSVTRDYFYVSDAVTALVKTISYEGEVRIFNIGSGVGKSLNDILAVMGEMGLRTQCRYLPARKFDVPVNVLDNSLAREHLNWKPEVPFDEGLARTLEWLRAQDSS